MDEARVLLKRKYGLVHVPRAARVREWHERVTAALGRGESPEEAGLAAAREVFPHELNEPAARGEPKVDVILRDLGG
jgi:hypothetical protein